MTQPRPLALLAGLCVAFALAGCGGGGSSSDTSATAASVTAADDTLSVPWNAATPLGVTDNDHATAGTLALASVGTAAHGQARIDGTQLVYTPASGYFGPDTLTYTVSAGGASATATVHIDVTASLAISGTVTDGPIANAKVTVSNGTQTQTVTADGQGHYAATLQSDDPAAFVTIDASGAGAQAFVKLRTLAGSFGALAAASSQGKIDSTAQRSLDVTHISTALAVLATQANQGNAPSTDAQLATAVSRIDPSAWEDMAAAIKTVVDGGVVLPSGTADTLALVSDASAYASFLKTLDLQQSADAFNATRNGVLQAMATGTPAVLASGSAQSLVLYSRPWSPNTAYLVQATAAGAVTVTGGSRSAPATLTRATDSITLAFSSQQPIDSYVGVDDNPDPVTQQQDSVRVDTVALKLQQAAAPGVMIVTPTFTLTYLDGSRVGQTVPDPSPAVPYLVDALDYAQRLPVQASEFAAGTQWAGFIPASSPLSFSTGAPLQDVFGLGANLVATALHDPSAYTFSVADNVLTVAGGSTRRDYVRLATDVTSGGETWLAIDRDTHGNATAAAYVAVVAAPAPFTWTASDAAHVWQLYATGDDTWVYRLNEDAGLSAEWDYWALGAPDVSVQQQTWQFGADQSITIVKHVSPGTANAVTQLRNWLPLTRTGSSVCMLQTLTYVDDATQSSDIQYRRVGCVADQGPTTP